MSLLGKDLSIFPGGDVIAKGLEDLTVGQKTVEALLVMEAAPRLTGLGFRVPILPDVPLPYHHALYAALQDRSPESAYGDYNALIQLAVSFANAYDQLGVSQGF